MAAVTIWSDFGSQENKVSFYLALNFRVAGRELKGDVQKMKVALESATEAEMAEYVKAFDLGSVQVKGFDAFDASLFIKNSKPKAEFIMESDNGMTVVLDTTLNEELINEGILREIIRNAQVLRKEADFKIDDRIDINITSKDANIENILKVNATKISAEVLAKSYNEKSFTPDIAKDMEVGDGVAVHYELKA